MFVEVVGIVATLFVLASFLLNDITYVRLVNIAGAAFFVAYGLMLGAFSTWFLNAVLIVIHFYFLLRKESEENHDEKNQLHAD